MSVLYLLLLAFPPHTSPSADLELKAAMAMGQRVAQRQHALPLVNQVVLVPDEATYLDELARWSPNARWPILFDDNQYAPRFIRRFRPAKVWRRSSVGVGVEDFKKLSAHVVASAWGGSASPTIAFRDRGIEPLGLVLTRAGDPARVAAVALAAGRGQLLRFTSNWDKPTSLWTEVQTNRILDEVQTILHESKETFGAIGDTIDAITVCMSMPSLANFLGARENPVATTDLIGRTLEGSRYAWCGWIFGTKKQSAYMAACSLFLPRDRYWFCNTYPETGGWENYGAGNMAQVLPTFGIKSVITEGTFESLLKFDEGGVAADVIYFTSKGNPDFLELADVKVAPSWLPILNTPAALYFIHSWSLKNPSVRSTVGGTWLDRGVYAYVGSSHEPLLQAFVPPMEVMRRTTSLIPLLPASRWFSGQGPYSTPWRINTIGDPLMVCGPNTTTNRKRVAANDRTDCIDAVVEVEEAMNQAISLPNDDTFALAIDLLTRIGRDAVASRLWDAAHEQSVAGPLSAKVSLPALFRMKRTDQFLVAFRMLAKPTVREQNLLWQLAGTRLETPVDLLLYNIRSLYSSDDLRIIAPRVESSRGRGSVLSIINKYLQKARGRNQRELERMQNDYGG